MYLNRGIKAQSLRYFKVTPEVRDQLAARLVKIDPNFRPPSDCPLALKEYQDKGIVMKAGWNQKFLAFRMYVVPLCGLMAIVLYSYQMIKQRNEPVSEFKDNDYKNLTLRQMQKKESLLKQEKQFDSILDALQNKLKDEYQEQLHEFQEFVTDKDESVKDNTVR